MIGVRDSTALITGITGQDGSYLAELLLARGYRVIGVVRPDSGTPHDRIVHLGDRIELITADLRQHVQAEHVVSAFQPREVYNLSAESSGRASWVEADRSGETRAAGLSCLLDAIAASAPQARLFQAGSSEMFGDAAESPQSETTPFQPRTPYAFAKVRAHQTICEYRERFGLYAVNGILFNHESPRRDVRFVTRKVTDAAVRIHCGLATDLQLGNLESRRDWGFAGDFVDAMWRTLQTDRPDDYVIGTGSTHSVRELCDIAFSSVDLDYRDYVTVDPSLRRETDGPLLVADARRLRSRLGWQPSVTFEDLVRMMVRSDLARYACGQPSRMTSDPTPARRNGS